jgi:hypothetical protein
MSVTRRLYFSTTPRKGREQKYKLRSDGDLLEMTLYLGRYPRAVNACVDSATSLVSR